MARRRALAITVVVLLCCAAASTCTAADAVPDSEFDGAAFFESFGPGWEQRWHHSGMKKYTGRFEAVQQPVGGDGAIQMPEASKHYGLAAPLASPLQPAGGLVLQYEMRVSVNHTCGGAYMKLLSVPEGGLEEFKPRRLKGSTPYTIMFGPDRCGPDARVHVILVTRNPVTQALQEHHLMSAPVPKNDKLSHLYTLIINNERYKVLVDGADRGSGPLTDASFEPPLQPPVEVPDPDDIKPEDWVEEEMMDDPAAVKPAGWDDRRVIPDAAAVMPEGWLQNVPARIPDTSAARPDDWDDAAFGPWSTPTKENPACEGAPGCGPWSKPMVRNPAYSGPWIPPQVKNPAYKGPWKQRLVPNPSYFKAESLAGLLPPIAGVGFELWTTDAGYTFDGVLLGQGDAALGAARAYLNKVWRPRYRREYAAALAAALESSRPPGWRSAAANVLLDAADSRLLRPLRPHLGPLLELLRDTPELAWAAVVSHVLLLGGLLVAWLRRQQARQACDAADEEPEAEEFEVSDADWEAEQKRRSKAAAELLKRQRETAASNAGSGGEVRRTGQ